MKQIKRKNIITLLMPPFTGVAAFAALSISGAYLLHSGLVPMDDIAPLALAFLAIAAFLAGMLTAGSGKRGILTGGILCLLYLVWTIADFTGGFLSIETLIGCVICLLCPFAASCIFHKKRKPYTRRNQRSKARQ